MKKTSRRLARTAGPAAVLTGVAAVAVAGLPGTASAAPVCFGAKQTRVVTSARVATVTCIFGYVHAQQTFQVPNGVYHANVDLIGGWGNDGYGADEDGGWGAPPDEVYATIPVQPHQTLYIEVGGFGGSGGSSTGGTGGWPDGAAGGGGTSGGGGGGGSSAIETVPLSGPSYLQSRLIVAAGGGGGGGTGSCTDNGGFGGFINDDNSGGTDGGGCTSGTTEGGGSGGANGGGSGGGGTDGSGGGVGGSYGTGGSLGAGGAGGGSAGGGGGGGGGGLYGGGGGGSGARTSNSARYGGGGGGGGGTSGTTNSAVRWTDLGPNGENDNGVVSLKFQQPTAPPKPLRGHSLTSATAADKAATASPRLSGRRP